MLISSYVWWAMRMNKIIHLKYVVGGKRKSLLCDSDKDCFFIHSEGPGWSLDDLTKNGKVIKVGRDF